MSQICFRQFSVKLNDKIAGFFFFKNPPQKNLKNFKIQDFYTAANNFVTIL